jgi:hypothetical protein
VTVKYEETNVEATTLNEEQKETTQTEITHEVIEAHIHIKTGGHG